jgi:hypothetical protein
MTNSSTYAVSSRALVWAAKLRHADAELRARETMTINPVLAGLLFLAGAWDMELSGASFLPDPDAKVRTPVNFEWI